jgi:hypothetical protein
MLTTSIISIVILGLAPFSTEAVTSQQGIGAGVLTSYDYFNPDEYLVGPG